MSINLMNIITTDSKNSIGWLITLIVLGLILFSLLMVEQFMTWIYIKSKIFNKPKYSDKIFILDYILLFICLVVTILVTVFYINDQILLSAVIVWWTITGIYLIAIIARFFMVKSQMKKAINPFESMSININELAKKLGINIDYHQYLTLVWKSNIWIEQVKFEYDSLLKQAQNISKITDPKGISNLLASIIVFYEKNILQFSTKKRKYIASLTLNLIENLQVNQIK